MNNFILNLLNYKVVIFIIGIVVGILINGRTNIIMLIKKAPIEVILGSIIVYVVFCQFLGINPNKGRAFDLLNFISNMAFAWMMTKYSVKNDTKEKQKEISAMAFRHSASINRKLKYNIKLAELLESSIKECNIKDISCNFAISISRIKDQLILIEQDTKENMRDWGNNISEEINSMNEISKYLEEVKDIESKIQQLDENSKEDKNKKYDLDRKRNGLNRKIIKCQRSMNLNVRAALDSINEDTSEHISKLQEKIDDIKLEKKQKNLDLFNKAREKLSKRENNSSIRDNTNCQQ